MDNKFSYNGIVTIIERVNNRIVSKKYHNNGTPRLFEAYSRALAGQPINNYIPQYIDIVKVDGTEEEHIINNAIPIVMSYKGIGEDGGDYNVSYNRISVVILKSMFTSIPESTWRLKLKSTNNIYTNDDVLATVEIGELWSIVNNMTSGVQLILLWDLYVTNEEVTTPDKDDGGKE